MQRVLKRGPKPVPDRGLELKKQFSSSTSQGNKTTIVITPEQAQSAVAANAQKVLLDGYRAKEDQAIRSYQISASEIGFPTFDLIFRDPKNLELILTMILDEDMFVNRVKTGTLPILAYAKVREIAKIANRVWPNEIRACLLKFHEDRLKSQNANIVKPPSINIQYCALNYD